MLRNHRGKLERFQPPPVQTHDRVIVIASGPSGAGPWPVHPGVPVIAVAGAVEGLGFAPDYWFTIDPTPINMARLAGLAPETMPILAVPWDYGDKGTHEEKFKQDFGRAHLLCIERGVGMTTDRRVIGVGNSGRGAVQLAMHMGARRIAVFGVDGTDDPHWHDPRLRSGNLKSLGRGCAELHMPGVDIVFADSGRSTVEGQTRATPEATLAWITEGVADRAGIEPATAALTGRCSTG